MATRAKRKRTAKAERAPAKRKVRRKAKRKYWSAKVMQKSDALDLKSRIFTARDPKRIARSLKRSAEHSRRRKAGPYQSAMSMLNFYLNRGGRNLPAERKRVLAKAKTELRRLFGRE
jgi:Protein of unknown function (DUF3175)